MRPWPGKHRIGGSVGAAAQHLGPAVTDDDRRGVMERALARIAALRAAQDSIAVPRPTTLNPLDLIAADPTTPGRFPGIGDVRSSESGPSTGSGHETAAQGARNGPSTGSEPRQRFDRLRARRAARGRSAP